MCAQSLSRVQLFLTLWTVACQASLSMGFPSQEYWSGLPFPPPGDLPNPGVKPVSLMPPALKGGFFTTSTTWDLTASIIWALSTSGFLLYLANVRQCKRSKGRIREVFLSFSLCLVLQSVHGYNLP